MINSQTTIDSALKTLAEIQPLTLRISGDCMNPLVMDGAVVQVRRCRFYWPGDILVFRSQDGRLLMHRFLGCYYRNGAIWYLTKADTASRSDAPVYRDHIIGKLVGDAADSIDRKVSWGQRIRTLGNFARLAFCHFFMRR